MKEKGLINSKIIQKENIFKKKRLSGIVFARSFCSFGIVIFHYFSYSKGNFKFLYRTANSSFGFIYVTSFFCISGAVLFYNYPKIISLKSFYFKRWKSIFPSYYICFSYFYLRNAFNFHKIFYRGHWTKLFFTLIGLDGYLSYRIDTYYLVGEWFLGAIIIIYIFYPLLLWIISKNNIIINNIFISTYYFIIYNNP